MFMQNATTFRAAEKVALSLTGLNLAPDACAPGLLCRGVPASGQSVEPRVAGVSYGKSGEKGR
jgi:hypothetical protein